MTLGTDYDKLCPIFNFSTKGGGVLFPFVIHGTSTEYVDLDGADTSTILGSIVPPVKSRLITAQAYALADGQGSKAAAASTEAIIGICYGTNALATAAAGTSIGVITCDGAGAVGKVWAGTVTATDISEGQEVAVYLKQAAASGTSANQDGGARVVLWFALANAPA